MTKEYKHFRLPADSEAGKRLAGLYDLGKAAMKAASDLALKHRADEFEEHPGFAKGGIGAFYFRHKPSARRWDVRFKQDGLYQCFPNTTTSAGRKVLEEVAALPVVKMEQVAEAFGMPTDSRMPDGTMLPMFFRVEQEWDYIKSNFPLSLDGLQEVSEEEFERALKYAKEEEEV